MDNQIKTFLLKTRAGWITRLTYSQYKGRSTQMHQEPSAVHPVLISVYFSMS